MEGESVPPPSEMEVGNLAQDAVPVKSLVDYSADVQHHENRQDDMDQVQVWLFFNVYSGAVETVESRGMGSWAHSNFGQKN